MTSRQPLPAEALQTEKLIHIPGPCIPPSSIKLKQHCSNGHYKDKPARSAQPNSRTMYNQQHLLMSPVMQQNMQHNGLVAKPVHRISTMV